MKKNELETSKAEFKSNNFTAIYHFFLKIPDEFFIDLISNTARVSELGMPNRFVKIDLNRFLCSVQEIDKIRRNRFLVDFCQNSRTIFVSFHFVTQLPRFAIRAWTLR